MVFGGLRKVEKIKIFCFWEKFRKFNSYKNIEYFGVSLIYPGHDTVPSASYLSNSYTNLFVERISWYSQESVLGRWSK